MVFASVTKALNWKTRPQPYPEALYQAIQHLAGKLTIDFVRQLDPAMKEAVVTAG
jgi:hypothetical protein